MASFTNNPLGLHLQCRHGLCSFIYGDSFAPRTVDTSCTPFEEGWAGAASTGQQQQRGITGCVAPRYDLASQWVEFGWPVMKWGACGAMWARTWPQWHGGRRHARAAVVLSLLLRVKLHIDRGPGCTPRPLRDTRLCRSIYNWVAVLPLGAERRFLFGFVLSARKQAMVTLSQEHAERMNDWWRLPCHLAQLHVLCSCNSVGSGQ